MKNRLFAACALATIVWAGCTKGGGQDGFSGPAYTVSAALNAAKVVPAAANDTSSGTVTGWFDGDADILTFTATYRKDTSKVKLDTITGINLYKSVPAAAGAQPDRILTFSTVVNATSKSNITGSITMGLAGSKQFSAEEKQLFLSGSWYLVFFSKKFPNGFAGGTLTVAER